VTRLLLTGVSAAGKSTLVAELRRRRVHAVDLDEPGWSAYGTLSPDEDHPLGAASGPEWLWRTDRVAALLDGDDGLHLVVAGCAANQVRFYPRFDRIVLLTAPVEVTVERLARRTTNPFGKRPDELATVLDDKAVVEPMLRQRAHLELDTTAPLDSVVAAVLDLLEEVG
jgi:shikimate kinase